MSIVHGVIDDSDITARILFPTREKEPFLPFERFAESVATSRKKGDLHAHLGQEVVTYSSRAPSTTSMVRGCTTT